MIAATLNNQQYSFEADVVAVDAKISYVAGVPSVARGNRAVASVSDDGAGLFTLTFNHGFTTFLGMNMIVGSATSEDLTAQVKAMDLNAKTIQIELQTAGSAADPSADCDIYLNFRFGATSVNMG